MDGGREWGLQGVATRRHAETHTEELLGIHGAWSTHSECTSKRQVAYLQKEIVHVSLTTNFTLPRMPWGRESYLDRVGLGHVRGGCLDLFRGICCTTGMKLGHWLAETLLRPCSLNKARTCYIFWVSWGLNQTSGQASERCTLFLCLEYEALKSELLIPFSGLSALGLCPSTRS